MRDKKRIKRIIKLLHKLWKANPDMRLTQLIGNCFEPMDLYYVEDENLEEALKITYKLK